MLVDAVAPRLLGVPDPYVPAEAEEARVAAWLASPQFGLLAGQVAGYAASYWPTLLGCRVVLATLDDDLHARMATAAPVPLGAAQPSSTRGRAHGRR